MKTKLLRRPFSLATRLTFFISLTTIAAFIAFSWILLHSVEKHFAEQDLGDLERFNATFEALLSNPQATTAQRLDNFRQATADYKSINIYLENAAGEVLYHSAGGPDLRSLAASARASNPFVKRFLTLHTPLADNLSPHGNHAEKESYRVMITPVTADGRQAAYTLIIAISINFHLHYLDELKYKLTLTALLIGLLIVGAVFFIVYQAHSPLRRVSQKIKSISSENLHVRLEPAEVPIELEQLTISFNQMIERIEDVFTRQSNFSADIAHEIRTPITNLVTQTEILLSQPRSEQEYQEVLYSNLEEYSRMAKMVSDMLFLAQADNNLLIPEKTLIDLKTEVTKVFDFFEAWAEEREVTLRLEGSPAVVKGDPLMLRRAINNLLSNAIRYTPRGMTVTVRLNESADEVQLSVENPGPPIAQEHLPRLFDRFYRVDPSRQRKGDGSGIGLAIVKSIVSAHRGKIVATSDAVATRFTLSLPKQSA